MGSPQGCVTQCIPCHGPLAWSVCDGPGPAGSTSWALPHGLGPCPRESLCPLARGAEPSGTASLLNLLCPQLPLSHTFFRISSVFFFLATLHGMRDFSCPPRDRTCAACSGSVES